MTLVSKYPKIHSLWKRQGWYLDEGKKNHPDYQKGRQSFIEGDYACPEFGIIKKWLVQEKIDGTNIRVHYDHNANNPEILGREEDSMVPMPLWRVITDQLTQVKLDTLFKHIGYERVTLFGEGYGNSIQKAGKSYRSDIGFILFDVKVNERWLSQSTVQEIAASLCIPYAPIIGIMTEQEIVEYVKSKPMSLCSETPQVIEGIIAKTDPILCSRDLNPIMMKLKCKEFKDVQ